MKRLLVIASIYYFPPINHIIFKVSHDQTPKDALNVLAACTSWEEFEKEFHNLASFFAKLSMKDADLSTAVTW